MRKQPSFAALLLLASVSNALPAFAQNAPPSDVPPPSDTPPPSDVPPPSDTPPPSDAPAAPPGAPPAAGSGPTSPPPTERVRFEPGEQDLHLLSLTGSVPFETFDPVDHGWYGYRGWYHGWYGYRLRYGWSPIYSSVCESACDTRLVQGRYHLALRRRGGPWCQPLRW